MSVMSAL